MRVGIKVAGISLFFAVASTAAPSVAAPVITGVNADVSAAPFSFSYLGNTFTFSGGGGFPDLLAVSTGGGAAVRTVFGTPSTDFVNRGTVAYDDTILGGYGSFAAATPVPYSNGDNFLGLRASYLGQTYYGFVYSTNSVVNSYGFETSADTAITATVDVPAAVPEPGTWMMMILGFGVVGYALRSREVRLARQ